MKQNKNTAAAFDLDDLERELREAAAPKRTIAVDDPLAELARIVGQDGVVHPAADQDGFGSFEDFLAGAAQAKADAPLTAGPTAIAVAVDAAAAEPVLPAPPAPLPFDPLEALLVQDLGLRSGLDDMPDVPSATADSQPTLDELLERELDGAHRETAQIGLPENLSAPQVIADDADHDLAPELVSAAIDGVDAVAEPEPVQAFADASGLDVSVSSGAAPAAKFDDMMAEFETAMREAAGSAIQAQPPQVAAMPAELPEPPPVAVQPEPFQIPAAAAVAGGIAAAGAAVIGRSTERPPRRGLMLAAGVIGVAMLGLGGLTVFGGSKSVRTADSGAVPTIAAKPGVTKERPANPGGVEVPNQDKEIPQPRASQTQQAERVAPREEQPVDLTQAQRQAAQQMASQSAPGVRQIPGVAIVAPVTTTPPSGAAAAPAEPQPRPVASVPITITGPSPVAPAPLTAPAAPSLPLSAPFQTSSAPPAAAQPASPPALRGTQPQSAQPSAAQPPAAQPGAEPRRVRSVPIRPESGEAAPSRAQPQPRVVPPAVVAAETPNAGAGPLRITPASNRGSASAAAPRQAPVQTGTVPSSVSSLEEPASAPAQQASASGSGFSVQIAAEGSEDAARAKFNRMRSQHGGVLGGAAPTIRNAEVNGRSVYRVRVGNMSRDEAASMCERLKASGGSCFVARN